MARQTPGPGSVPSTLAAQLVHRANATTPYARAVGLSAPALSLAFETNDPDRARKVSIACGLSMREALRPAGSRAGKTTARYLALCAPSGSTSSFTPPLSLPVEKTALAATTGFTRPTLSAQLRPRLIVAFWGETGAQTLRMVGPTSRTMSLRLSIRI
jgi:hypothetical protein